MHASRDTLVAARQECPLIVGVSEERDVPGVGDPGVPGRDRYALPVENGEIVTVTPEGATVTEADGAPVQREVEEILWDDDAAEKGGYATFMRKEIDERPDSVAETIADRLPDTERVNLSELDLDPEFLRSMRRIVIVACGTSYHAGLVGRYAIEQWARVPVEMDIASEYRYRDPVVSSEDLVIGITQSGETADTLAAMRLAREKGATVLALTNVMGSQATRDSDAVLFAPGRDRDRGGGDEDLRQPGRRDVPDRPLESRSSAACPGAGSRAGRRAQEPAEQDAGDARLGLGRIKAVARAEKDGTFFLYLGRNIGLPVCLEGALKMKEISIRPTRTRPAR